MSGGIVFDLYIIGVYSVIAVASWLALRYCFKDRSRPFDYEIDAPEFTHAKETHLRLVDGEWFV